jgi:hypothetical protein
MERTTVQLHARAFRIQRFKKWKAHQMVPMGMGKNKIEIAAFLLCQLVTESSNTGSGINNDNVSAFRPDFQTGCVSAVF